MHVQHSAPAYTSGSATLLREVGGIRFEARVPALVLEGDDDDTIIDGDVIEDIELRIALWLCTNGRLAPALSWIRRVLGLTQTELAGLLSYSPETLSRWENGHGGPPPLVASVVAELIEDRLEGRSTTRDRLTRLAGPSTDLHRVDLGSFRRAAGAVLEPFED